MNLSNYKKKKSFLSLFLWWYIGKPLFQITPRPFNSIRCDILRAFGASIGSKVIIRNTVKIHTPWKLSIGKNSWIGENVELYNVTNIVIGKNVCISQQAFLCTASHDYSDPAFRLITKPIIVKNCSWVGARSFIHPGVTINYKSIIGAMSNVTKNTEENSISAGNPCKKIKDKI